MKINLQTTPNESKALVQMGRNGNTDIVWSEPFEAQLYLQKDRNGLVSTLAIF